MKKLKSKKGETISEALVSFLIITMMITLLATAVIKCRTLTAQAKKIQRDNEATQTAFYSGTMDKTSQTRQRITFSGADGSFSFEADISEYTNSNGQKIYSVEGG